MEKTIFSFWGITNSGKSSTIKLIAWEMLRRFYGALINEPLHSIPEVDIRRIIQIKQIKIGITSQGDPGTDLKERLEELVSEGCVIIVCATRTSGATVSDVEAIERQYGYKTVWVTPYQTTRPGEVIQERLIRNFLNQHAATSMVNLIERMYKL